MGALIISIIKFVVIFMLGIFLSLLLLLSTRSILCDDIKESTGRNLFQNKRKKNKKYPNRLKWFLLWGHISKIKKWRYAFFIIQIPFSIAIVVIVTIMISQGSNQLLSDMLIISIIPIMITELILLSVPWGRYRN